MKKSILNLMKFGIPALALFLTASCSDDDNNGGGINNPTTDRPFHLGYSVGPAEGNAMIYIQGQDFAGLNAGSVSFDGFGFQVPATRTAFVFSSEDGRYVYALNYGGGTVGKYESFGGQNYSLVAEANVQPFIGTANPRWTKLNESTALLHNVTTEHLYDSNGNYTRTSAKAWLTTVNLADMSIGTVTNFEIPYDEVEAAQGVHVFRIDKPFVQNGKVYYGVGKRKYDSATGANGTMVYTNAETLVVDFPSLTNPSRISTNANGVHGATNGYRTPVNHADENGNVFQTTTSSGKIFMLKISNGNYDNSYNFDISAALGHGAQTNGWFYVGNGIGYMPYFNSDLGAAGDNYWGVARIDLNNKTVVDLELPGNMWLQQYQSGVVANGKFYMSLAPIGATGYIYAFDINSTSPTGYTKGATIQSTGAENYHIGIY